MTRQKILKGSPLARAICESGVGSNGRFLRFLDRNGARCDQGYYWTLIENRMSAFDWYQDQRPWMTLNWPWAAITRFFTLHICLSGPTTKIRMKIDPYYQRQKCRPKILVSTEVRFMRIFWGFAKEGASNEGGVVFFGDFRPICRNIS